MKKILILAVLLMAAAGIAALAAAPDRGIRPIAAGGSAEKTRDHILEEEAFDLKKKGRDQADFNPGGVLWQGGEAACDLSSSTIYIPCSPDTDAEWDRVLAGLVPAAEDTRLWFCRDRKMEDMAGAVREGHAFRALLENDESAVEFSVVLTGLPALCLHKTDRAEIVRKENHEGRLTLVTPYGSEGQKAAADLNCLFHVRGNISATLFKKPYKITLRDRRGQNLKAGLLDLREDDDWILNPLYTDETRVREMTAYSLWDRTQALAQTPQASSRMRYIELFLDDTYMGLYGLMEPVDRKQLALEEGDLLYKIDRWDREYPYYDLYEEKEDKGETEIYNDGGFPCVEIRWPNAWDRTATWKPMQAFHRFCFHDPDPDLLEEAGLKTEPDNIAGFSLYCALTHAMDNTWKNSFVIARKKSGGYDLYRTIWDLNYVFGDVFVYAPEKGYTVFDPETAGDYTPEEDSTFDFEAFLQADPGMKEVLSEIWKRWREKGIDADLVCGMARENLALLEETGAAAREMAMWPQDRSCDEAVTRMEEWIRRRFEYLDDLLD